MPQTQQSSGAFDRETSASDAMEGGMDHGMQNFGEEVSPDIQKLKVNHLLDHRVGLFSMVL